ncbi:MAG: ThiF family adenylyltransferase [Janthinobacterium lividum]
MSTSAQLDACFEAIEAGCQEHGVAVVRLASAHDGCIRIELQGALSNWGLYVHPDETSLKLPSVWLNNPRQLLAHVSYDGVVCFNDTQGLSVDTDRYPELVAYAVREAYLLLERSAIDSASTMTQFYDELEGYWLGMPESRWARSAVEVDGKDRFISAYVDEKSNPSKWYFAEHKKQLPGEFRAGNLPAVRALYIHVDRMPLPPAKPGGLGVKFIESLKVLLSTEQLELWAEFIRVSRNKAKRLVLLVSMPRAAGGFSLVGVVFGAHRESIDATVDVVPLTVRRHTPAYMRERGGASIELLGKHVAILGCGAVGSYVADTLACSGVGKITLVDYDEYSEDNVFRHVLPPHCIGTRKVFALKVLLEDRYPGLQVTCVPTTAQKWMDASTLVELDGVVVAFGAPSLERDFSRRFRRASKTLLAVFTWLEPLDLGGHSVLMNCGHEGCLDCLYRDEEGQPALSPRSAFLEPNQSVSRNLTGCASTFTPYGAIQARRTGLMAAEQMLDALVDRGSASYRYWVGEGSVAAAEGLRTTNWWANAKKMPSESGARVFGRPCARCRDGS